MLNSRAHEARGTRRITDLLFTSIWSTSQPDYRRNRKTFSDLISNEEGIVSKQIP